MNKAMSGIALSALVLGALLGYVASVRWPGSTQSTNAVEKRTHLERQVSDLRADNARLSAELDGERARGQTIAGDLRREKEINMRLHMLVSDGKK